MRIKLVGSPEATAQLEVNCRAALEELALLDAVEIHSTNDPDYKTQLKIQEDPALCIEEDSIQFRDMIFEGVIPERSELCSLFTSIFGGNDACNSWGGCSTGGCDSCATGCQNPNS